MRTGDIVRHILSGEEWLVAWADRSEVICCGWPEASARPDDCELIRACSDKEHWDLVEKVANSGGDHGGNFRARRCFAYLEARRSAECAAMMHL